MNKLVCMMLVGAGMIIHLTGCSSPPKMESDKTIFDHMQEQVDKITKDGGMASLGVGKSRNIPTALSRAKMEARKNMAQLVSVKIENLEKSFTEEIGEASASEVNDLFSSATKQITNQKLQGSVPKMQKFETNDGVTTAYVLMIMNPDLIHEALKSKGGNAAKHLYERFRASKAFDELDQEIKKFNDAEQADYSL